MTIYAIPDLYPAVLTLRDQGYVMLDPYKDHFAWTAQTRFRELVDQLKPTTLSWFSFCTKARPDGLRENNLGFIDWVDPVARSHAPQPKDLKYVFQYNPVLWTKLRDEEIRCHFSHRELELLEEFLDACNHVYEYNQSIAEWLLAEFDRLKIVPGSFAEACRQCNTPSAVASYSVLRVLYYPPSQSVERARVHFDRDLLTLHSCDSGGELFVRHPDGTEQGVSPPPGRLLAFWGVKAGLIAEPHGVHIPPVAHLSRAEAGQERSAVIFFCHSPHEVWDAPKVLY